MYYMVTQWIIAKKGDRITSALVWPIYGTHECITYHYQPVQYTLSGIFAMYATFMLNLCKCMYDKCKCKYIAMYVTSHTYCITYSIGK